MYSQKGHQEKLHFNFLSPEKLTRLFLLNEVKPSSDHKTEVQTLDNLFPHDILAKHVEERRRLPRFPAKTDACLRAHTSYIRKISFS